MAPAALIPLLRLRVKRILAEREPRARERETDYAEKSSDKPLAAEVQDRGIVWVICARRLCPRADVEGPTSGIVPRNTTVVLAIFSYFTNFHRVAAFFTDSWTQPCDTA
jgi:hypothetical protein